MGLGPEGHGLIAGVFLVFFMIGVLSASISFSEGDYGTGGQNLGLCIGTTFIPALIFLYFASKLAQQANTNRHLSNFLVGKQRCSLSEVASAFHWTEPEAEERIIAAISENVVRGHFDRGTKQFYIEGSQQSQTFLEKCLNCGAPVGMWVSQYQSAVCPYCHSDPRGHFTQPQAPAPYPVQSYREPASAYVMQAPAGPPANYFIPAGPGCPYPQNVAPPPSVVQGPVYAPPVAQQPYAYQAPPVYVTPIPINQLPQGLPPPPPIEVSNPQKKNVSVKFLFFSAKPNVLKVAGIVFLSLAVLLLGAFVSIQGDGSTVQFPIEMALVCGVAIVGPFFALGLFMLWRAWVHETHKTKLLDVADYLVTYRTISFILLARKMNLPEDQVRRLVYDIQVFGLIDGQVTPDGTEFVMKLRSEDVQYRQSCPYCTHPNINVQVIRGGSQKCPYCGGLIYFTEEVHR
jgi:hypothetical protein